METRLLLIRHAQVDTRARLCGSYDIPLSQAGREQLHAFLQRPATNGVPGALYTSTLCRAREVAAVLSDLWHLKPRLSDAVREIDCGLVEGMRLKDLVRDFPDVWARNWAQTDDDFAWPGGESYRAFRNRLLRGFREIADRHAGQRVAIVTHAGVISQVLGIIQGRPAAVWQVDRPDPLTATEVTWADGGPVSVLRYNDRDWP